MGAGFRRGDMVGTTASSWERNEVVVGEEGTLTGVGWERDWLGVMILNRFLGKKRTAPPGSSASTTHQHKEGQSRKGHFSCRQRTLCEDEDNKSVVHTPIARSRRPRRPQDPLDAIRLEAIRLRRVSLDDNVNPRPHFWRSLPPSSAHVPRRVQRCVRGHGLIGEICWI